MEVSSVTRNSANPVLRAPDQEEAIAALPRPDLSQMIPFKPKLNALPGEHPVPGKSTIIANLMIIIENFVWCKKYGKL